MVCKIIKFRSIYLDMFVLRILGILKAIFDLIQKANYLSFLENFLKIFTTNFLWLIWLKFCFLCKTLQNLFSFPYKTSTFNITSVKLSLLEYFNFSNVQQLLQIAWTQNFRCRTCFQLFCNHSFSCGILESMWSFDQFSNRNIPKRGLAV